MKKIWLLWLLLVTGLGMGAQEQQVAVKIRAAGPRNEPVPLATVTVLSVPDTLDQFQKLADSSGTAVFQLINNRPYLVRISSVEYKRFEKSITVKGGGPGFTFVLEPLSRSLSNVVITTQRPLMRQEDDKTIVDPENLALSSTNAYEILEKTPALFVDQDGNIYLNSTTPAKVYINGREQKMSTADLATVLKSLPPYAIASIEIMRTPSARYDASGSGGIVNVILRKGIRIGLTGSITAGFNQGDYGNRFLGFTFNNNDGRLTNYLNLQVSERNNFEVLESTRFFTPDSMLSQHAFTKYPAHSYYLGYGLGYQLTDKWELNYDGRLSLNRSQNSSTNESEIRNQASGQLATASLANINNNARGHNISQGINLKYKMDSAGSEWVTDLSYTFAPNNTDQVFQNRFSVPVVFTASGDGVLRNRLHFFSGQTNFLKKFRNDFTIETGVKSTNVWFENSSNFFRTSNGNRVTDPNRTGAYDYLEQIHAAYFQASKNFHGFILKAGTRLENTNMTGHQLVPADTSFSLHRTDLFPYVYFSRNIMKIANYELRAYLVYRRTIHRPAYENLNPAQRVIDPYLYETGNPSLRPQFTSNYEANISVDERPIFAIGYNDSKDIFSQVIYQADSTRSQAFRTYDNLGTNKETYFRGLGAIPPGGKYFFVIGTQYTHSFYQGLYENKPLRYKRGGWTFFTYHQLKLTPNTQVSMHGFARLNTQIQFYELSSFGQLSLSVNQLFFKKKLTLSVSATDIFYTNKNDFTLSQGTVKASGTRYSDTRRFGVNLRYNFGIRKKEDNKLPDIDVGDRMKP